MDVYTVSTSTDPNRQNYPAYDWFRSEGWQPPVLVDSEGRQVANAFGLTAFPFSVFVYADGTIAARATGAIPYDSFLDAVSFLEENQTG